MYGIAGGNSETFTYSYKEKIIFSLYYGIPVPTDYLGSIRVSGDVREVLTSSGEVQSSDPELFPAIFEIPIEAGSKLTITIEGD